MKTIVVALLVLVMHVQVFAEGAFRLFGDASMPLPERESGVVRAFIYRDASSPEVNASFPPVYVRADGHLVAPLLRGGYVELVACEGSRVRIDLELEPSKHRMGHIAAHSQALMPMQSGVYFGKVEEGSALRVVFSDVAPDEAVRQSIRPQIHAKRRAPGPSANGCGAVGRPTAKRAGNGLF